MAMNRLETWKRWGAALFIPAALIVVGAVGVILPAANRYWLDHHGILASAMVTKIEPQSDSGGGDFGGDPTLDVLIGACTCIAKVDVASNSHPVGSFVRVRYDPNRPTHAIAVEDPPAPNLNFAPIAAFGLFLFVRAARARRRAGTRTSTHGPKGGRPPANRTSEPQAVDPWGRPTEPFPRWTHR